jgi:hypothetical protein
MGIKRLTGDFAQTTIGANAGINADTSVTITADTTAGSDLLANVSSLSGLVPGQDIAGAGIPAGTTLASLDPLTLSANATATASGVSLTVTGATQVLGLTDWTMTIKVKTVDATTTDDDAWEDSLPSSSSWTAKAKYVYLMGDPSQMVHIIQAMIGTGRRLSSQWNFFLDSESGDDSFTGQAYISGLGISSVIGRTVTMDVSLQGRGPLNLRNLGTFRAALQVPTGQAKKFSSNPFIGNAWGAVWSNFVLCDLLPSDAVIKGIYPVIIASGVEGVIIGLTHGGSSFPDVSQATFASTEFTDVSIGTSLSDLAGREISMFLDSSLFLGGLTAELDVTGVGYAIYYESATPTTDNLMPPPNAVPAGQGLAWALPFAVRLLGDGSSVGTNVATTALVVV